MTTSAEAFEFRAGDRVTLSDDDWALVARDIVLVDAEPVPGSTQCVVTDGSELRVVCRFDLRRR